MARSVRELMTTLMMYTDQYVHRLDAMTLLLSGKQLCNDFYRAEKEIDEMEPHVMTGALSGT